MAGWEAAEKVVHYVAPVGHKQEYVERAYEVISPYLPALRSAAGGEHQPVKEKEGHHAR
jgi:hypothetical protein